uniref:Uncharacterized protein n=1 Tax=Zea mays TaxID=4577 RepID=B6T0H9_MAIZE|nr:hypothetical protein [Zea mays]
MDGLVQTARRSDAAATDPPCGGVNHVVDSIAEEPVAEDLGEQQVEVAEQELIEGEEQVVQEEPQGEEYDLI